MPPILPAADEEGLDADRAFLRGEREDIRIAHAVGVDRLAALDEGERLEPIAQDRGKLEIHIVGRGFHFGSRSEEHTSELQSLMRISYAVFCLKKKNKYHYQRAET